MTDEDAGTRKATKLEDNDKPAKQTITPHCPKGRECRILVVDDKSSNRKLLCAMLEPAGFTVKEAEHGGQALVNMQAWRPHLVLMDLKMPVMDGYEAIKKIREDPNLRETPVIAVTASVFKKDRAAVKEVGADGFLSKPIKQDELLRMVSEYAKAACGYSDEVIISALEGKNKAKRQIYKELRKHVGPGLRSHIRKAAVRGDILRLRELIDIVRDANAELGAGLRELAEGFHYEELAKLCGKAGGSNDALHGESGDSLE